MGHVGIDLDFAMHSGTFRIVNDATNYWGHAEAFASQKNILRRISWADPYKTYSEWARESRARQIQTNKDVKKYGYRTGF
jgi:hypothetical protein